RVGDSACNLGWGSFQAVVRGDHARLPLEVTLCHRKPYGEPLDLHTQLNQLAQHLLGEWCDAETFIGRGNDKALFAQSGESFPHYPQTHVEGNLEFRRPELGARRERSFEDLTAEGLVDLIAQSERG